MVGFWTMKKVLPWFMMVLGGLLCLFFAFVAPGMAFPDSSWGERILLFLYAAAHCAVGLLLMRQGLKRVEADERRKRTYLTCLMATGAILLVLFFLLSPIVIFSTPLSEDTTTWGAWVFGLVSFLLSGGVGLFLLLSSRRILTRDALLAAEQEKTTTVDDQLKSEELHEKMRMLPLKKIPHIISTTEAQIKLLDILGEVVDISLVKLKTEKDWQLALQAEEGDTKPFTAALKNTFLFMDKFFFFFKPDYIQKQIEAADFDQLVDAWAILNFYSEFFTRDTSNISLVRNQVLRALLTRYGDEIDSTYDAEAYRLSTLVKIQDSAIYFDSKGFQQFKKRHAFKESFVIRNILPLHEKEPVLTLYENGAKVTAFRLQTEGDEDFTGKDFCFQVAVDCLRSDPIIPALRIDGVVSDTPDTHEIEQDAAYRLQVQFLSCDNEAVKQAYEQQMRGQDLFLKALKYRGITTPSFIRLVGVCPDCGQSFCFHSYAVYLQNDEVAYSDDGLDCCRITKPIEDKKSWKYETNGKMFRYYNSFCCPHCGSPYIDYQSYPQNKEPGVSACVHLGRKLYTDQD